MKYAVPAAVVLLGTLCLPVASQDDIAGALREKPAGPPTEKQGDDRKRVIEILTLLDLPHDPPQVDAFIDGLWLSLSDESREAAKASRAAAFRLLVADWIRQQALAGHQRAAQQKAAAEASQRASDRFREILAKPQKKR